MGVETHPWEAYGEREKTTVDTRMTGNKKSIKYYLWLAKDLMFPFLYLFFYLFISCSSTIIMM